MDITESVSVNRCWHDMYAGGQADTLHLRLNDVAHLWDSWQPSPGDEIRLDFDTISTGTMFLTAAQPQNGYFEINAQSAPASGYEKRSKAWQRVRFLQIGQEIAQRNGLEFAAYGVENQLYEYIPQDNMGDFALLSALARAESCAVQVYDKRLILYSEPYMEAMEPSEVLTIGMDGGFCYTDRRAGLYGSCIVTTGQYSGTFAADNGSALIYRPEVTIKPSNSTEAERFAKGFLRSVNKGACGGFVRVPVLSGYAPGSVVNLENIRAQSWDGPVFLDHVRNDYVAGRSKIFFRKPLEGY